VPSYRGASQRIQKVAKDVRALGSSAPLRAAYEASKLTGGHKLLFREVEPTTVASVALPIGNVIPTSTEATARCLEDANAVVTQGTRVFGTRAATGIQASWSTDPLTGREWERDKSWWEIDIRSEQRLSDVKFVWESGRHRDLVVLARASALDPAGEWLSHLDQALSRWFIECPPERGVHWYSSLELALRAIAWAQVIALVGESLPSTTRSRMEQQLIASARHLMLELPYTVSSMKNNHLIGDGLGLVVLGHLFPTHPAAKRWVRIGDRLMLKQLNRHMRPDGSMIEDSLSYHRFVMEMLIVRHLLGNAPSIVAQSLAASALHLVDLGVLEGPVPQYGDWDEGRVLADSGEPGSTVGSTLLALHLSGHQVSTSDWGTHDELAWYASPGAAGLSLPDEAKRKGRAGYFTRTISGGYQTWLKVSGGPSHQHADLSALWIQQDGSWLTEDPGTGTYNGPLEVRNGFRTSSAHNVWCPDGEDQLQPHRAFRWLKSATGNGSDVRKIGDYQVVLAVHDAFTQPPAASRVARLVLSSANGVIVFDAVETSVSKNWTMTIPLGKDSSQSDFFGLDDAEVLSEQDVPFAGWHSPTYGSWNPRTWLLVNRTFDEPVVWGVGELAGDTPSVDFKWDTDRVTASFELDEGELHTIEVSYG